MPETNPITHASVLRPSNILVTYVSEHKAYVEIADIIDEKPGPFRPLGFQEAVKLGSILQDKTHRIHIGRIPQNLLYMDYNAGRFELVWFSNATRRKLFFKKDLGIPDKSVIPIPALVWQFKNDTLYVYALKDRTLNDRSTLYKAPFHNIHDGNSVCMGDALTRVKLDSPSIPNLTREIEEAFFRSYFTTMHQNPIDGNLNALFNQLARDGNSEFPLDVLVPTKLTLINLFSHDSRYNNIYNGNGEDDFEFEAPTDEEDDDEEEYETTTDGTE